MAKTPADEQPDTPYEVPEDVTTIDDLAAAEEAASAEANELSQVENPTDEQLDRLDALADHIDAIRGEGQRRETEAETRRERQAAAAQRIAPADDSTTEEESGTDDGDADADADADTEGDDADADAEAVAASARKRRAKKSAPSLIKRAKRPDNPQPQEGDDRVTIIAGAGIPQVEAGSTLDGMDAVTAAFQARARSHPKGNAPGVRTKHQVATFSRGMGDLTDANAEYAGDGQALLDEAGRESRVRGAGQSLAAAGGWCAPSQTLYDLIEMEQADGLIDVPEVGVTRGGIRFTLGPDFVDIYANSGFAQSEAQAIAGTTKDCFEVDCPDFDETRLDAVGICVKSPILTDSAYPELVRRTLNGVMVAHEHRKSARVIASMATELGAATVVPTYGSTARNMLTGLELAAEGERNQRRLGVNTTLEVVLPHWVRAAMRDDLQARQRQADPVTDAQLDEHFAARKLRVQFVFGYGDTRIVDPPGANLCLSDFPDTVPAMLYPAGTFVKGVADVISLDTMYDSTDLQTNVYTAAFAEEGLLLAKRQPGGCNLTFVVSNSGRVGPADLPAWGITDV